MISILRVADVSFEILPSVPKGIVRTFERLLAKGSQWSMSACKLNQMMHNHMDLGEYWNANFFEENSKIFD